MEAPYSPRRGLDSMKRHQDLYKKTPDWKRKYKGRILFFHLAMSGIISGMFQDARRHDFERTTEKDLNCTARWPIKPTQADSIGSTSSETKSFSEVYSYSYWRACWTRSQTCKDKKLNPKKTDAEIAWNVEEHDYWSNFVGYKLLIKLWRRRCVSIISIIKSLWTF